MVPSQPVALAAPGLQEWRRLAERSLKGRDVSTLRTSTRDGIAVEPLYAGPTSARPLPGRGARRWEVIQIIDHADPDEANAKAREDIEGGATGLALRVAEAATGRGPGLGQAALRIALEGINLSAVRLRLEPHLQGPTIAGWLKDFATGCGYAPERTRISFGLDPIGQTALHGAAAVDPMHHVSQFVALRAVGFKDGLACLDARPFHEAGASEAQELAVVLGAAVFWLRALEREGISAEHALPSFDASLAVDRDQLLSIARLRALRLLWARLQELCGAEPARLFIHAETSRRMMTRADPHSNILRTTIAAFAAGAGGADSIAVLPYTDALGSSNASARALARNTQHLLMDEAHIHRLADPGAGSGAIEALTDALAEAAWAEFQAIECEGGILESLRAGALQARIEAARARLAADLAAGETPLVGATVFAGPDSSVEATDGGSAEPRSGALAPIRLEDLARGMR